MFSLKEDSPQLLKKDIDKIYTNLNVSLKTHQQTCINAMLSLENDNKIIIEEECKISKNVIIFKKDYINYQYHYPLFGATADIEFKMHKFEINTNFGILADKVGAGKTFEIVGLLCHRSIPASHPKIIGSAFNSLIKWHDKESCIKTNLVIVPHGLILQWKDVLEKTNLNYYVINKKNQVDYLKSAENIFDDNPSDSEIDIHKTQCVGYYDLILVSGTMLENLFIKFPDIKWSRIVIDEVTSIKLPAKFEMKSNFTWFISATPTDIRYVRKMYIKDYIYGLPDNVFKRIIIKNDDDYVSKSMSLPPFNQIIIRCNTPRGLYMMREFIPKDVINMLNAGNIKDAITRLNCNVDTQDNILKVLTTKIENDIYNTKLDLEVEQRARYNDKKAHEEKLQNLTNKITSLENKYNAIKQRIVNFNEENCPICLDSVTNPAIVPCCNNLFCLQCLSSIINSSCPMCRQKLSINDISVISKTKKEKPKSNQLLSKKDNLINIIKKKPNGKFLVFSSYENTNDNIAKILNDEGITFSKIAGSAAVINNIINKFTNGTTKVLLLNASQYGSGLNLQMATDIIIYHELRSEIETQVIGRAQRLGRTEPLNVFYLLHDDENSNCKNTSLNIDILDESSDYEDDDDVNNNDDDDE